MKKLSSLLLFSFIALLFVAFYSGNTYTPDGSDNPNYQTIKKNFWDEYQIYKSNLEKGITTPIPVDPTGTFFINKQGYTDVKIPLGSQTNSITPPRLLPDLVSGYTFTQSTTTYTSINTTGTLLTSSCDDGSYTATIPFTFVYNGANYTTMAISCNGWLALGAAYNYGYTPICDGTYPNAISPFGNDLYGLASGNGIYYQTTGSAPNRIFIVEWYHWGFYGNGANEMNFMVKLYESTNTVQFVYQPQTPAFSASYGGMTVGISGTTNTDFNIRTTVASWAATTAGATSCSYCTYSSTIYPANGLTFSFAPPAPPAVPTLLTPANHRIGMPLSGDTISWTPSAGATNYNLVISLDSLATQVVYNDTTLTGTSYIFSGFSPLLNWWWKVRAKNAVGWSAFTVPWVFRTKGPSTVPTLITPANNATNQPVAFTSNWSKAIDQTNKPHGLTVVPVGQGTTVQNKNIFEPMSPDAVTNYWYELYTDTTTTALIKDSTLTDTTRAISGLANNTNYWWRVKGKNDVGWGPFSGYFKFTTVVAVPPAPTNIYPPNNSTGIDPMTLIDWSSSAGATQYKIQLSTDSTFATVLVDTTVSVDSVRFVSGRLPNNTKLYWHVRAQNVGGNSAYSPVWNFTTSPVGIVVCGGGIPNIFKLYQAYPNPFNPTTTIKLDLPLSGAVKLEVFNMLGQALATLVNGNMDAGSYSITWNAANFSSGVYFYKINAGKFTDIHKMVLIK